MYEPSKTFENFYIAGFQHWDGPFALPELKVGQKLELRAEPDNPADSSAIVIYGNGHKLGYVPRCKNETLALLMFYGHVGVFEAIVGKVDAQADPWEQVYVCVRVRDAR